MKISSLIGKRIKDVPREATAVSHQFLLRGGYVRPLASGIYSILPLGKRVLTKIEAIIREEMDLIGGQEVLLPVVMPRELWEESGRYQSIDNSMVRFKDRNQKDFVLGMTHEEAVLALARSEVSSYKQFPFMLYQIQTKFRDEPRPRSGLIRVREFTMKDAYSFHRDEADLVRFYTKCYQAYERIFKRAGLTKTRIVQSDSGMMGGAIAHEFMLEADIGEDSLVLCDHCGYSANNEVAICRREQSLPSEKALQEVVTPSTRTIEELCKFLNVAADGTAKTICYSLKEANGSETLILCMMRGDKSVNEVKLAKILKTASYTMASEDLSRSFGVETGYASAYGLRNSENLRVLIDSSILEKADLVAGANKKDTHLLNFNAKRDVICNYEIVDIAFVADSEPCMKCGEPLRLSRGIEIGNIFQLGDKYSRAMGMSYLDEGGESHIPVMGCYGIGVGRLMASVIEDSHDSKGPIWPWEVAPFEIHLCMLDGGDAAVFRRVQTLYESLLKEGFDVLWDDSNSAAGAQFADADLIGAPLRLIVSPRNEKRGVIEYVLRTQQEKERGEIVADALVDFCRQQRDRLKA